MDEISPLLPGDIASGTFDNLDIDNASRSRSKKTRATPRVSIKLPSKDSIEVGGTRSRNSIFFLKNTSKKGFLIK